MMKLRKDPLRAEELLKKYITLYEKQDLEGILKLFSKDINLWGTGIDEYRRGLLEAEMQIKRDWEQAKVKEITTMSIISPNPTSAAGIFKVDLEIEGKQSIIDNIRLTIVTNFEDRKLKIFHLHVSVPDSKQAEGNSFRNVAK